MRSALRAQAPSHVLQSVLDGALFKAAEAGDEPCLRELLAFELCALVDYSPQVRSRCALCVPPSTHLCTVGALCLSPKAFLPGPSRNSLLTVQLGFTTQ